TWPPPRLTFETGGTDGTIPDSHPKALFARMTTSALMVIAHRGASSYAPENTFAAFDLALQMGARHIELDVEATRDGHIVVIHDGAVDRTTDGSGPVAGQTLEALQALDAGSWVGQEFTGERIPPVSEQ